MLKDVFLPVHPTPGVVGALWALVEALNVNEVALRGMPHARPMGSQANGIET